MTWQSNTKWPEWHMMIFKWWNGLVSTRSTNIIESTKCHYVQILPTCTQVWVQSSNYWELKECSTPLNNLSKWKVHVLTMRCQEERSVLSKTYGRSSFMPMCVRERERESIQVYLSFIQHNIYIYAARMLFFLVDFTPSFNFFKVIWDKSTTNL